MIFDSGSKTLTNDGARGFTPAPGFGVVIGHDNLLIERLSEEHATVKVTNGSTTLEPGDRVRIIPNHSCVVSNLVDQAWLVDGKMRGAAANRGAREESPERVGAVRRVSDRTQRLRVRQLANHDGLGANGSRR